MLPTIIFVLDAIRRALKKSGRGLSILADAFGEALDRRREMQPRWPFAE
jgi:hypothetical protein